jgi:chemotaxis protein methyltransferase CheR
MAIVERTLDWDRLRELVAEHLGLHFSLERRGDLLRGLRAAAAELGFRDPLELAQLLLGVVPPKSHLAVLATHLTIGETYFLRGRETWAALLDHVLPALARARNGEHKRLRFWSAACCTGEEAYSLAIMLHQALPDIDDWRIEILGTDINPRFLQKAATGIYGQWSFRGVPAETRRRYFRATGDGSYAIAPEIRRMVRFARLNLVQDEYPSGSGDCDPFDLILCQNVLMYFAVQQAERVVRRLHRALREDGWLVVAPCEVSAMLDSLFMPVKVGEAILHKHRPSLPAPRATTVQPAAAPALGTGSDGGTAHRLRARFPVPAESKQGDPLETARQWARRGRHDLVADRLLQTQGAWAEDSAGIALLANALANLGRLAEGRAWCERWIEREKMSAAAHYLHASVLMELGELPEARAALRRCLYLAPETPMYSYALANLERRSGREPLAEQLYRNALSLLPEQPVASSAEDQTGMSQAQLRALVLAALGKDASDA